MKTINKLFACVASLATCFTVAQADEFYYKRSGIIEPEAYYRQFGLLESIDSTYNDSTKNFKLKLQFSPGEGTGQLPSGFYFIVSDGENPKQYGGLYAEAYVDFTNPASPKISVYADNGAMNGTSWKCGDKSEMMTGTCTKDPYRIINSINNPSFVKSLTSRDFSNEQCGTKSGVNCREFSLEIDTAPIHAYNHDMVGTVVNGQTLVWKGMQFKHQAGWWIHFNPQQYLSTSYYTTSVIKGFLSSSTFSDPRAGRYDTAFDITYDCAGDPRVRGLPGRPGQPLPGQIFDLCNVCGGSNACLGCDGVPNSGIEFDRCGVCGGTDACVGCDGVPFSGKTIDSCGVCGGNNECTGNGQCTQSDISSQLFSLDGVTNSLKNTVLQTGKALVKFGGKSFAKEVASARRSAVELNTQAWTAAWSYGQVVTTCPADTSGCTIKSFAVNAATVDQSLTSLLKLNDKLASKLAKVRSAAARARAKTLKSKASTQLKKAQTELGKLPTSSSSCSS